MNSKISSNITRCIKVTAIMLLAVPFFVPFFGDGAIFGTPAAGSLQAMLFAQTAVTVHAQEEQPVSISVFVREDCGHCRDEKAFLAELVQELPNLNIYYYDIAEIRNAELFKKVAATYGFSQGTPITMVGDVLLQGFQDSETTGSIIRRLVTTRTTQLRFEDILDGKSASVYTGSAGAVCDENTECTIDEAFSVKLPLIGTKISVGGFSLTSLSLVLGFVDGFNPCALWVLLMFLLILSQAGSKKRMFQYAGLFIFAEAVMYYLILNVWFTAWNFIGLNRIVTPLIGLLALGSGAYFIYKFATFKNECAVIQPGQQKKLRDRIRALAGKPMTLGVVAGILVIAFSVNVFEFACSVGIPQTFTKILELNNLAWAGRQWYMLLYILMYMVDDLIVFGLALWGFDKLGLTHKYSKWATLVGGVLMVLLGLVMLIKPELLIF